MGKRARQQKRRAQKRKKRRVTFGTAAATKVIPASDPARASGPDRSRRRGAACANADCFFAAHLRPERLLSGGSVRGLGAYAGLQTPQPSAA